MADPQRPTMKNVAARAGVSFKTVSRVVNHEPGVSRQLEERVAAAIAELGYEPNHGARTLRRTLPRTATIGFVHADISNPFMAAVHRSLEAVAAQHDCLMLSGASQELPERFDELVRAFAGRRVDGLAIIPVGDPLSEPSEPLVHEIDRGTPVVFVDRDPGFEADVVLSDHRGGAELATRHLLDYGHRAIAFLGSRQHVHSVAERQLGFETTMASVGSARPTVITGMRTPDDAFKAVLDLLSTTDNDRPTAIFAAQNGLTLGAVRALHQLQQQHQVALVGFDHLDAVDLVAPAVTTVPQDAEAVGRLAGELLFSRLLDGRTQARKEIVPVRIVARGSGEISAPN